MTLESLQLLIDDLDAIDRALEAADYALAGRILIEHDHRLRTCLDDGELSASMMQGLHGLLERQHSITSRMIALRDHASEQLRSVRQSGEAARAYRETGT